MRRSLLSLLFLLSPVVATGQSGEDAAHRADRLRTQQLNQSAGSIVRDRNRGNDKAQTRYQAQRADYERRMAAWRRQVAACRQGDTRACATP